MSTTVDLLNGEVPQAAWICHTCKRISSAMGERQPEHYPDCLYVEDETAWQNAFANSAGVPVEYPHASSETNVGKYFWRAALAYERNRTKEKV